MLKNLPDYVPAGLVKDLRQSLHSPVYLILYGIAMMLIWILYMSSGRGAAFFIQVPLFLLLIPLRASLTVAADTNPRGNNFMQLTALSSREIAWGIMLSSLLQMLITALFISLIIGLLSLAPQQRWPIAECWEALAGCVIGGALMTGFLMLAARVNLIFRLGAAVLLVGVLGGVFHEVLKAESWWIWPLLLTNAAIALLLLVEFARRGYASPSENTTRMVQLLTLTPLALFAVLQLLGAEKTAVVTQLLLGCWIACIAATLNIALPVSLPPRKAEVAVRWLPRLVQKPGVPQAALFLCLVAVAVAACLVWGAPPEGIALDFQSEEGGTVFPYELSTWKLLVSMGVPAKWLFSVLLTVLVLDGVSARSHPNRLLYFAIVAASLLLLGIIVGSYTDITCIWPYACLLHVPSYFPSPQEFRSDLDMLILTNAAALVASLLILILILKKK